MQLLFALADRKNLKKITRYFISGTAALALDLFLLYVFTDLFGWWYLFSTVVAFSIAIVVSFFLQKFWTFEDKTESKTKRQFAAYLAVSVANTALNTFLVYFLVESFGLFYLFSQLAAAGLIAIESFFVYQNFIFKKERY